MVTKELVDFVRGEFAKGVSRGELMTLLMSQGWAALDTQEAFNAAAEQVVVAPQPTVAGTGSIATMTPSTVSQNPVTQVNPIMTMPQSEMISASVEKSSSGMLVYVVISVLVVFIGIGGAYLWYGTDIVKSLFKTTQTETESSGILFNNINVVEGTEVNDRKIPVAATSTEVVSDIHENQTVTDAGFDKMAVIAGVLASQETLKSQDIVKIRAYLLNKATTPEQKKQIGDTSDKDLSYGVGLINALQVEVTKDILESPDTLFTKKSETLVEISFYPQKGGAKATVTATKINGVWY